MKENKKEDKKDLEETIKEKVLPLLEETMEKSWGITIPQIESDITDRLKSPPLSIYVPSYLNFQEARKLFRTKFIKKELSLHQGNISQLAKTLDIDRRSIHRAIKELDIDMEKIRHQEDAKNRIQEEVVNQTINSALERYSEIIQPHQLKKMYEEVPSLSRNIAKFLPHQDLTLKEAEKEFEKQFLSHALDENGQNVTKTANKLKIRVETLHRKIKKLRLK
jgi:transcriptional regulator with PAS, ATPase and Fis domain